MKHTVEGHPLIGAGYDFPQEGWYKRTTPDKNGVNHQTNVYLHGKAEDLAGYDIVEMDYDWLLGLWDTLDDNVCIPLDVRILTTKGLYFAARLFLWRPVIETEWCSARQKIFTARVEHKALIVLPDDEKAMNYAMRCCREKKETI